MNFLTNLLGDYFFYFLNKCEKLIFKIFIFFVLTYVFEYSESI